MPSFPTFRYMQWAKAQRAPERAVRYSLALSGMAPPDPSALDLDRHAVDLAQRGAHMPPVARERVAARLGVPPERLMLTLGSSHGLYLACATCCGPGDTVLVETPCYEVLAALPTLHGAKVETFDRSLERGHRPPSDLAARIAEVRPAMVVLSNPHNPTGAFLEDDELSPIIEAAAAVGAVVLVDEVYLEFFEDPGARSAARLGDHVIAVSSFTKAYGLGAVRFGWLVGSEARVEACVRYNDYVAVLFPNPCAWAGLAALEKLPALAAHARAVRAENLPRVDAFVASRDDVRWHPSEAGIIGLVHLDAVADTSAFCEALRRDHDLALVPGDFFGAPGAVRLGFGIDAADLDEALTRLGAALDALA